MDRISDIFASKKPLVVFTTAGYPDPARSEEGIAAAIENGADIIELGVPFSDPMADGPVIAAASQQTAERGYSINDVLALAGRIRAKYPRVGIILFSYMNPMLHYGYDALCAELARIGVDGILPVDLPLEERDELLAPCRANDLHPVECACHVAEPADEQDVNESHTDGHGAEQCHADVLSCLLRVAWLCSADFSGDVL